MKWLRTANGTRSDCSGSTGEGAAAAGSVASARGGEAPGAIVAGAGGGAAGTNAAAGAPGAAAVRPAARGARGAAQTCGFCHQPLEELRAHARCVACALGWADSAPEGARAAAIARLCEAPSIGALEAVLHETDVRGY